MSELVGYVLKDLLLSQGFALLGETQQLQAILEDICPDEQKVIELVMLAFEEKIPERLLIPVSEAELPKTLTLLSQELSAQKQLAPHFSDWIVETWANALGKTNAYAISRNLLAEAEEMYRDKIRSVFYEWDSLSEEEQEKVQNLRQQLLLNEKDHARIWAEVREEQKQDILLNVSLIAPSSPPFQNGLGMKFIRIEPGKFLMGSPEYEHHREEDETQHSVTLSKPYWIQTTPVTQAQWEELMGFNPSDFKNPLHPVENVSWLEIVQRFLPALNARGEGFYRLPTEAEWEYASRAGNTKAYSDRNDASTLDSFAWYNNNSNYQTQPVALKTANPWGLYDMHGNVWEWCHDWHAPFSNQALENPRGPAQGKGRVMRGGSWFCNATSCRQAARGYLPPETRVRLTGFRLVRNCDD
ncbi:hypothetical protein COW36_14610 [bacterium (Candidatus Blackallbacteria) CG17_big_fil_post_rev_8_21_14_2_50_48_46]|uniref:Sulfatase-modifying factor enzyme-like domain-containing protein n=1 Tax=bacterium (Candidatus Blackallbacteria) CG17_big_fil_post_rev_8_21_14_2_50_48_46 TaxID=2014261 RepID=A0A2M7G2B8_9BACT|nr:MAG: hypothetical protein COW64_11940 [bacterium (Candidatus Blackallbacteria) CG18_big_fil_WC_8_21_14_2_50_49_26]PIW15946.1 MAG: hypothetical protein COW36_14610 [bacterium (Candidatus Blackallbacteria) CG17_big_fil_post_rev_8_21_14_2_50_48_46]PIW50358.1 MAG: hypothetical protein COW20_02325 [bacterium (Candidatus Blackallbacteria) CG13_big_fil_rev_8_21_14_2_50_49_14]